jgi:superfamily II DNA or RNA helicase
VGFFCILATLRETQHLTITLRPHQQRIIDRLQSYDKGQILVPTGGGKTLTMILDTQRRHDSITNGTTTVVVAPRILLAEQLCSEFLEVIDTANTHIMHVHSGETHHYSSTKADKIHMFANTARTAGENVVIFTSYNSLQRIVDADIEVNTIYFDEAHNSVKKNFFPATEFFAENADRCYFYTATPKHSLTPKKPGMNWSVYGLVLVRARKGGKAALRLHDSVYLHSGAQHESDQDDYTPRISGVLRNGDPLAFPE